MLVVVVVGGVDDLDQHVGPVDLLEGRPERVDELVRQLVDEAHGVGHDRRLAVAELDLAAGRIERGEQLVLGARHLRADERVEQGRLAGVRVADDADGRPQPAIAAARRGLALLADLLDAFLHLRDPGPDDPPVGLELALAGSPGADPAAGARLRCVHSRVRRGSWYSSWASSTWSRPSWVWAWRAKMSRISRLRSMTLTLSSSSSARCWAGDSSSSATSRSKPVSRLAATSSSALPLPTYQFGSTWRRFCHSAPTTSAPGGRRQVGQLGERVLGRPAVVAARVDGDEEGLLDGDGEIDELMGHAPAGYAIVDAAAAGWAFLGSPAGSCAERPRARCTGGYPVRCS